MVPKIFAINKEVTYVIGLIVDLIIILLHSTRRNVDLKKFRWIPRRQASENILLLLQHRNIRYT